MQIQQFLIEEVKICQGALTTKLYTKTMIIYMYETFDTDEGSIHDMRIWSILFFRSDFTMMYQSEQRFLLVLHAVYVGVSCFGLYSIVWRCVIFARFMSSL